MADPITEHRYPYHWDNRREKLIFWFTTRFIPGLRYEYLDCTRNSMDATPDIPMGGFDNYGFLPNASIKRE